MTRVEVVAVKRSVNTITDDSVVCILCVKGSGDGSTRLSDGGD